MGHLPNIGTVKKQTTYLTVRQVAERENVTVWAIHRRIKRGVYPGTIRTESQWLIPASAVTA